MFKRNDLLSVCKEEKLMEAVVLLGQGEVVYAECFGVLFGLCGKLKKLEEAKKVHDCFLWPGDVGLVHKVIDMYCKCGSMVDAHKVFDHMGERNMDFWHLIINGYAGNWFGDDGLKMFEQMRNNGLQLNEETFDVWSRVLTLPFESTTEILEAVGNYARNNGDIELEDRAEEILISLDMSKVDPKKIPTPLPKKYTAISMLEGKDKVNEFMNSTLYEDEENIRAANKEQIYVPNIRYILHDIDQEAKELA
ncbi:pentatricopeptide repeat-containing protein [Tanacetum coccineum]|uniref:Pentatricopeptide repeat-containing protein n=1 Tax=Tanacetum coccineum TaxID=301880 RepID=A0ABQ4YTL4_9ASTR